ncbi:MAG: hypothetical protein L0G36_06330, partial [Brevibacterium sp.]|nr:hypothetical protein [Brevibacterium sp.]
IRDLDRVLWLEDGQIVEDGAPNELAADPGTRVAEWMRSQAGDSQIGNTPRAEGNTHENLGAGV